MAPGMTLCGIAAALVVWTVAPITTAATVSDETTSIVAATSSTLSASSGPRFRIGPSGRTLNERYRSSLPNPQAAVTETLVSKTTAGAGEPAVVGPTYVEVRSHEVRTGHQGAWRRPRLGPSGKRHD